MEGTLVPAALDPSLYIPELKCRRKDTAIAELVGCAERAGLVRHAESLLELLMRREALGSTALGKTVAIPAARSLAVREARIVVGRSRRGVEWDAPDQQPVHLVALVLSPADCPAGTHVDTVARIAGALRLQRQRQRLIDADGFEQVAAVLREVLP